MYIKRKRVKRLQQSGWYCERIKYVRIEQDKLKSWGDNIQYMEIIINAMLL